MTVSRGITQFVIIVISGSCYYNNAVIISIINNFLLSTRVSWPTPRQTHNLCTVIDSPNDSFETVINTIETCIIRCSFYGHNFNLIVACRSYSQRIIGYRRNYSSYVCTMRKISVWWVWVGIGCRRHVFSSHHISRQIRMIGLYGVVDHSHYHWATTRIYVPSLIGFYFCK